MARKKKLHNSGMRSLKDLGPASPGSTLSRLATTVKVVPGMIGAGAEALVAKPAMAVSQAARRLFPFKKASAAKKVDKLAREGGLVPKKRRVRRSRLPLVIVVLLALIGSGAYYTYQTVSLPTLGIAKLAQYLDYETWLHKVSGGAAPQARSASYTTSASKKHRPSEPARYSAEGKVKGSKAKRSHREKAAKPRLAGEKARKANAPKGRVLARSKGAAANVQVTSSQRP